MRPDFGAPLERTLQLEAMESLRDTRREYLGSLCDQRVAIDQEVKVVERELEQLDKEIEALEWSIVHETTTNVLTVKSEKQEEAIDQSIVVAEQLKGTQTQADELLTDPMTLTMLDRDESSSSPDGDDNVRASRVAPSLARVSSGVVGPLEFTTTTLTSAAAQSGGGKRTTTEVPFMQHNGARGPLDTFFAPQTAKSTPLSIVSTNSEGRTPRDSLQCMFLQQQQQQMHENEQQFHADTSVATSSRADNHNNNTNNHASSSQSAIDHLLRHTFGIPSFRDHQREIIHSTLRGEDVFVIMRTGGGKSLTYQLPALFEGRRDFGSPLHSTKVTLVVSPLLSLIQDQEDQMNQFCPQAALSFTSNLPGGPTEHARRWARVRDPKQGVCMILVTPEMVNKSGKLRSELQKLFQQGRLGRFVIDEGRLGFVGRHCACQWGHDFRPDYAKLGVLKRHFPTVPVLAVTATASERVKEDVCKILELGNNYRFFRSTANRPNLHYSVRPKPDGKTAVVEDMVAFIKEQHAQHAGIVYTFSRKDADTVANALCEYGIVARSYHSSVAPTAKDQVHRSWMRNDTQVVVATIAFGLGINKPDVRFVIHHSLSKSLETYYQESGRAGRDGKPANCVLYYSPKDVPRMIKMVHGSTSETILWHMVRYGQASGNDAVCRAMILAKFAEPGHPDPNAVLAANDGLTSDPRDVGPHAKTVIQLLSECLDRGEDLTMSMLVKEWRAAKQKASASVNINRPAADGLSISDCERIIVAMLVEDIIDLNVVWNAYDAIVYLKLGRRATELLASTSPKMVIRIPKREEKKATSNSRSKAVVNDGEWLASKSNSAKRKKIATKPRKAKKAKASTKSSKPKRKGTVAKLAKDVIELLSDDEEIRAAGTSRTINRASVRADEELFADSAGSDNEYEFD